MEWEMVAAIAHLITAVGVIPSLIYLAVQIRRENVERRRASVDEMTSKWGDVVRSINDSRDFGAIYLAGVQSFDDLPPVEGCDSVLTLSASLGTSKECTFTHRMVL